MCTILVKPVRMLIFVSAAHADGNIINLTGIFFKAFDKCKYCHGDAIGTFRDQQNLHPLEKAMPLDWQKEVYYINTDLDKTEATVKVAHQP